MRLDDESESSNVESQSGRGFGFPMGGGGGLMLGGGRMGCGSLVLVIILALVFKVNPLALLGDVQSGAPAPQVETERGAAALGNDPTRHMVAKVLGSTERVWSSLFEAQGKQYQPTTLVFYDRLGRSGCGAAQSAMGPFYCPTDEKIYLDTAFFDELRTRFGAPGQFAQAYVVAHEVGHHIQKLLGVAERVTEEQSNASRAESNALQVKMELQADCYAGVWAKNDANLLEPGDAEAGLRAAQAIGDDTLEQQAQGYVVPESFTHGTSAQRMKWLRLGLETGDPAKCDTFSAAPQARANSLP
jgi:predicted metalloprotease